MPVVNDTEAAIARLAQRPHPRVLIFANRGFGDLVCDTVLFRGVRAALAHAHIGGVLRSEAHRAVFAGTGLLDEAIYFNADSHRYVRDAIGLLRKVRRFKPDLMCVSTETDASKGPLICRWSGASLRVGEAASRLSRLYTHSAPKRLDQHKVQSNWDILAAMGVEGRPDPTIGITDADRARVDAVLDAHGLHGLHLVAMHPGSRDLDAFKRWPADRFAALSRRLGARGDVRIVYVGGPTERDLARRIGDEGGPDAVNLAGQLTLGELAALCQRCEAVVGNDSGPMHIAAAVGAPSVVIFGPTSATRTRPWGDHVTIVNCDIQCAPCFPRLRFGCGDEQCLKRIEAATVYDAVARVLDGESRRNAAPAVVCPDRTRSSASITTARSA